MQLLYEIGQISGLIFAGAMIRIGRGPGLLIAGSLTVRRVSPAKEGEGMGLYNAASDAGTVCGAILGGVAAELWGYRPVAAVGAMCVVAALVSTAADRNWRRPLHAPQLAPLEGNGSHPSRL